MENFQGSGSKPKHDKYLKENRLFKGKKEDEVLKIRSIIREQFESELIERQNHIEHIEDQIGKTQKLLHLIKYAAVTSFYNNTEIEQTHNEQLIINEVMSQKRLHPALKKIISGNAAVDFMSQRGKRKARFSNNVASKKLSLENISLDVKIPDETASEEDENTFYNSPAKIVRQNNIESSFQHNDVTTTGWRNRREYKIIIGNISTWMLPELNDSPNYSHKWMIYIRGTEDSPQISHFIDKVIFYLHPSFKPHDVFEISEPPFHLKRVGWGEFPVKLKLFFKCPINKPLDITHDLKLPKTFPGKQITANETTVKLFLQEEATTDAIAGNSVDRTYVINRPSSSKQRIDFTQTTYDFCGKNEPLKKVIKVEKIDENEPLKKAIKVEKVDNYFENEHCFADSNMNGFNNIDDLIEQEITVNEFSDKVYLDKSLHTQNDLKQISISVPENIFFDHCYYRSDIKSESETSGKSETMHKNNQNTNLNGDTSLMFGLGDNYFSKQSRPISSSSKLKKIQASPLNKNKIIKNQNTLNKNVVQDKIKNVNQVNRKIIVNKTAPAQSAKDMKISSNRINNLNSFVVPENYKSVAEVMPYLFRNLPLYMSGDNKYRCFFMAMSLQEFKTWNVGKQLNSEWIRAKTVLRLLKKQKLFGQEKWNIRSVIMYGRSHGYTPSTTINLYSIFNKNLPELQIINQCFVDVCGKQTGAIRMHAEVETPIDIVGNKVSCDKKKGNNYVDISDPTLKDECSAIRQHALDAGIVLKSEEIEPGILFNGAERMIFEAVKCLTNNLVRRARHHCVARGNFREFDSVVGLRDVQQAIKERSEILSIIEYGKTRRHIEFYS